MISVFEAEELLRAAASGDFPDAGDILRRGDDRWVFGPITVDDFSLNFDDIDGIIDDRLQLPVEIAYEDEVNTFALDQIFSANLTLAAATILTWGGDTDLFRASANLLKTNDSFTVGVDLTVGGTAVTLAAAVVVTWGGDTNLFRDSPNVLKTDDAFIVGGTFTPVGAVLLADGLVGTPSLTFASETDLGMYRKGSNNYAFAVAGADVMEFTGSKVSVPNGFNLEVTTGDLIIGIVSIFTLGADVNLFRDSANVLKTDDAFVVGLTTHLIGNVGIGVAPGVDPLEVRKDSGSGASTNVVINNPNATFKRMSLVFVNNLSPRWDIGTDLAIDGTNDFFIRDRAGGDIVRIGISSSGDVTITNDLIELGTLFFGAAKDTNLFRDSANVLKTNDAFFVGGTLTVQGAVFLNTDLSFIGTADILITDNLAAALEFKEGSNLYMRFITTNGAEEVNIAKNLTLSGNLTLAEGSQTYVFTDRGQFLTLQGQSPNQDSRFELFSFDGDGTERVVINLFPVGSPSDITNSENLFIGWDTSGEFQIKTQAAGTGVARALMLETEGNADQLRLETDGNVRVDATLLFGSAGDTNLFRDSANVLKTDDSFTVGSLLQVLDSTPTISLFNIANREWSMSVNGTSWLLTDVSGAAVALTVAVGGSATFSADLTVDKSFILGTNNSGLPAGTVYWMSRSSSGAWNFNVPTGEVFEWNVNNSVDMTLSAASLDLPNALNVIGLVRQGTTTLTPHPNADNLALEGSGAVGLSILNTTANQEGVIFFGDSVSSIVGQFKYDHNTDSFLWVVQGVGPLLTLNPAGALVFGTAGDTNLYRDSANVLKTDDAFTVVGVLNANAGVVIGTGTTAPGKLYLFSGQGVVLQAFTGTSNDFLLATPAGAAILAIPTGTDTAQFTGEVQIGADLNHDGSNVGFMGVAPQAQQAHIVDADGTLADITTKFNTLLADIEGYGLLATV